MRKLLTTTAAAALAVPALAFGAAAQDATPPQAAETPPAAAQQQTPPAAGQEQQAQRPQITVETVLTSISEADTAADEIASAETLPQVGLVRIDDTANPDVASQVDEAVATNQEKVGKLREALANHKELGPKLKAGGVDVETIVAARMMENGALLLFMRA